MSKYLEELRKFTRETKEIIKNEQTNSNDKGNSLDELLEVDELNR